MLINITGSPQLQSQLFPILAWLQNCEHTNRISEFKIRVDNTDSKLDLKFEFDNSELQKQYKEYLNEFNKYNTAQINPIYYIGNNFVK